MYFASLDEAITLYLRRTGKTQKELAHDVGMAANTFSWKRRGERGREFTLDEVAHVAKTIGMTSLDGVMADIKRELVGVA